MFIFEMLLYAFVILFNFSIFFNVYMKSSFPKRYKSILIVFMKMTFFLNVCVINVCLNVGSV